MNNEKKIEKQLKQLRKKICCLIEEGFDFSTLPEFANNTAAISGGLTNGKLYRLPMEDDQVLIAVVIE